MLIASDSNLKDVAQGSDVVANRAQVPEESPPAYAGSQQPAGPSIPLPPPIPNTVKPANFLSLSRTNATIKGTYVVDPCLKIPPFLLPPLGEGETEETRRNVHLETTNAPIDTVLFIVGDGGQKEPQRVDILLKTTHGSIKASVHAAATPTRPAINLTLDTLYAPVVLRLPRSFRGPVTLRTQYAAVTFSDALTTNLTTFNELDNTHRCFVGDFADWAENPAAWRGDEVNVVTSPASIKLKYDVEADQGGAKRSGFWGRLFGALSSWGTLD
ncbi:hypothetical protein C8R46DRAFT_483278 [Mycena filopes]|nr:hypothetical protein C8R46DRAFT_483278 [Mycena filopes]